MTQQATDWARVPTFGDASCQGTPISRPSAYAVIADASGCVAVVRTPKGVFLPGGGIDPGESPREAVHREVREECGLLIRLGRWQTRAVEFVHSVAEKTTFEKRSTFFDATVTGAHAGAVETDHELEWLSVEDAVAALTPPSHQWAIAQWRVTLDDRR